MSGSPLGPFDSDLASLLDAEREAAAPREALNRVWTRVARTILPAGPFGGSGSGGASTGAGWLASHAAGVTAAAFVVGAAVGASVVSAMRRPTPERIVYVDRPAPSDVARDHSAVAAAPSAVGTPVAMSSPSAVGTPMSLPTTSPPLGTATALLARSAAPSTSPSLSVERGVLDDARAALTSGDARRALALSDEHLRRFPRAQLGEEREALAIQSLVALGRYAEARARAASFRASTPHSLLLPAIETTLSSIP